LVFGKFRWRKDRLFEEAMGIPGKRQYENWVIFRFGMELRDLEDIDLIFRGPNEFPDAVLVNMKTEEALNVEFEEFSSHFRKHRHDPSRCDLIVCAMHDWRQEFPNEKCSVDVYVVGDGNIVGQKFFPKEC